jgi:hypothetical protein
VCYPLNYLICVYRMKMASEVTSSTSPGVNFQGSRKGGLILEDTWGGDDLAVKMSGQHVLEDTDE